MGIRCWLIVPGCSILGAFPAVASSSDAEWRQVVMPYRSVHARTFALAPSQPSTVYMVTANHVYRSDQRGESWSRTSLEAPPGASVRTIAVSPLDRDHVFASVSGAIYRTLDGGTSWAEISPPIADSITQLLVHPNDPNVVLAVPGGSAPGIHESRNGGVEWEFLSADLMNTEVRRIARHAATPNVLIAATDSGIIRSVDDGEVWGGVEEIPYLMGVEWSADASRVFAVARTTLYRSDDAGETFSEIPSPNVGYYGSYYSGHLATHPTDSDLLVFTGSGSGYGGRGYVNISRSNTGGEDWTSVFSGSSRREGGSTGVAIDPSQPDNLYYSTTSGRDAGFRHFSGPGFGTSVVRNSEFHHYRVSQVDSDSAGHTFAVAGTRLVRSNSAGTNWTEFADPYWDALWQGGPAISLWVNDAGPAFYSVSGYTRGPSVSGYTFYVARSLNHGLTWEYSNWKSICGWYATQCGGSRIVTNHGDGHVFYVLGLAYALDLYRVEPTGTVLVDEAHGSAKLVIDPRDSMHIYSTFGPGAMSESFDGGLTWVPADDGLPFDEPAAVLMRRDQPDLMQCVFPDGSIYRSVDAARSWRFKNTMDVGDARVVQATWDPHSTHVFATTDDERLVSTWPEQLGDLPSLPMSIHYATARRALLVGTAGSGLVERRLRQLPERSHSDIAPEPTRLRNAGSPAPSLRISPNPSSGDLRIGFEAPGTSQVRLDVFDASGRLVRRLSEGFDRNRPAFVAWDGRGTRGELVPSGVYFVRLESESGTEVRKVTFLR